MSNSGSRFLSSKTRTEKKTRLQARRERRDSQTHHHTRILSQNCIDALSTCDSTMPKESLMALVKYQSSLAAETLPPEYAISTRTVYRSISSGNRRTLKRTVTSSISPIRSRILSTQRAHTRCISCAVKESKCNFSIPKKRTPLTCIWLMEHPLYASSRSARI